MNSQLERIRLLQNRMRKKTKVPTDSKNQQSVKSIKSTDSKKIQIIQKQNQHKREDNENEDNKQEQEQRGNLQQQQQNQINNIVEQQQNSSNDQKILSQEQIKRNKKITDYFCFKPSTTPIKNQPHLSQNGGNQSKLAESLNNNNLTESMQAQLDKFENNQSIQISNKIQFQQQESLQNTKGKTMNIYENSISRQQTNQLRQQLKKTQKQLQNCKSQMIDYIMKYHKLKRMQLKRKISNNKIRLGQFIPDKRGKEIWVDGTEIRQVKQKIDENNKKKEQLQKLKKQSKKTNKQYSDPEDWKIALNSQSSYLSKDEQTYQEILRKLQQDKAVHIKEYKLLYDEDHSKYGRVDPQTGVPNWIRIKKYQLLSLLGKGGFSEVYLAYDMQQMRQAACKIHQFYSNWSNNSKENYIKHALRQNSVHKALSHPNIVKLYDTVQMDSNSFCTVLEYCDGPDLSYYLKKHKRIPQKQAKMYIKQVINAIRYLHSLPQKVIHYDLKPMNILFHKGKIKITDFGLCKIAKQDMIQLTSQGVGTYWYLPPECFETDKKAVITPKVDIWSIGVVYYEMLYGQKPFGQKMSQIRVLNQGIMLKATNVNFPTNQKVSISNQSKQFIRDCLKANVEERMDIWAAASHKLFEKK